MLQRLPDSGRLPRPGPAAARAAVSPSGLVLAGAGAGLGVLSGLPAAGVVVLAGCFWGARVAIGAARAATRRHKAQRPETIDPYAVTEPWRSFVRESLTAQSRFDQAVTRAKPGPLRDRMIDVSARVHDGARECWRVAHLGAALDAGIAALDPAQISAEMRRLQAGAGAGAPSDDAGAIRAEAEAALARQLQAARRVEAAAHRATVRLQVLTAELNAAVASAVELSLDAASAESARELEVGVDTVVGEIEALRQALEETSTPSRGAR